MATLHGKHDNRTYRALELLGSGGEGSVYSICGDPSRVMKIYHDPKPDLISKITMMVESDLKRSSDVSFPEELIFEGNRFRGYVMKRARGESLSSVYVTSTRNRGLPQEVKFTIAKNLCIALSNVHEAGFVFGDFNPANIKVDTSRRTVTLMDTDSFVFDRYGGFVARPEVVPSEIRTAMRRNESVPESGKTCLPFTRESDTYALAVHLFRLLMNGEHPFTYKPTRPLNHQPMYAYELDPPVFPYLDNVAGIAPPPHAVPLESIPFELQTLFVRMFRDGYSDPSLRPSIRDFLTEIDMYERSSVKCAVDPRHMYLGSRVSCPFCEADMRHSQALRGINPGTVPVSKENYLFDLDYEFLLEHPDKLPYVRKRATAGSADSQLVLGMVHSDGILDEQNDRRAVEYFLKAASSKRPNAEAQYRLGLCFLDGIGVPTSKNDAVKWLTLSSRSGFEPASQILGYIDGLEPIAHPVSSDPNIDVPDVNVPQMPEKQVVKAVRRTPQQKCIDDVVDGDIDALRRLHGFVMDGKIDWASTPSVHGPFEDAAKDDGEFSFLYSQILDSIGQSSLSEEYLENAAHKGYGPAMTAMAESLMSLFDPNGHDSGDHKGQTQDNSVDVREETVVDPIENKQFRAKGGMSVFFNRIKNLFGRN